MDQTGSYETHYLSPKSDQDFDPDHPDQHRPHEGLKFMTSTLVEIADAMKSGLNYVNKSVHGMPPYTFLAYDATSWILKNVEGWL